MSGPNGGPLAVMDADSQAAADFREGRDLNYATCERLKADSAAARAAVAELVDAAEWLLNAGRNLPEARARLRAALAKFPEAK